MRGQSKIKPDDFKHLFAEDCEQMEVRYGGASIYKYFYFPNAEIQSEFLSRPTVKFAHKSDLEDPFELGRRWEEFGCPFDAAIIDRFLRRPLRTKLSDVVQMRKRLASKAKERMPQLSRRERRRVMSSKIGDAELAAAREDTLSRVSSLEFFMPIVFPTLEQEFINEFAAKTGILSLTANPASRYMWDRYAGGGRGFVLEYNAVHEFFMFREDSGLSRKLIRPVFYRNDRISEFWKNPYYLFLVKHEEWKKEEEWRVIKSLDECRKLLQSDGRAIYLVDAPQSLIASIIFGYRSSDEFVQEAISRLSAFDKTISFKRATIDDQCEVQIRNV